MNEREKTKNELVKRIREIFKEQQADISHSSLGLKIQAYFGLNETREELSVVLSEEEAVPILRDLLRDKSWHVRWRATIALRYLKERAIEAVPALIQAMREDEIGRVRSFAALALGRIGAKEAIPFLKKTMREDSFEEVRLEAAWALEKLGVKKAVPTFIEIMKEDEDSIIRQRAAEALWKIGKQLPKATVLELAKTMREDPNEEVRYWAALALKEMGDKAAEAVPALIEALQKDEYYGVRVHAALALGYLEEKAVEATPVLIQALQKDEAELVREYAAWSLGGIGKKIKEPKIVPALIRAMLGDKHFGVRYWAVSALKEIGEQAIEAIPALEEAVSEDTDEKVRKAAAEVLRKLGVSSKVE